ncbi:hypothetical protein GUJ93_ZPchr0001g31909 [Zizania palustris]|uniref:Uncharacterized protein n=1 Tax=Zizania palustris TaxID=103762 RepID=A0A8J5R6P9_ZIZPA|nr:hypothetical protein GUJ93_ZPchr0001g31909 [Zizania palustris]
MRSVRGSQGRIFPTQGRRVAFGEAEWSLGSSGVVLDMCRWQSKCAQRTACEAIEAMLPVHCSTLISWFKGFKAKNFGTEISAISGSCTTAGRLSEKPKAAESRSGGAFTFTLHQKLLLLKAAG